MTVKEFIDELPGKVDAAAVDGHNTKFHFDVSGEDGGQYTLAIDDGVMSSEEGLSGEAKCVVKASSENLLGLISGDLNPMMAIMTGKVKISNQGEMLKYAKIFGLM